MLTPSKSPSPVPAIPNPYPAPAAHIATPDSPVAIPGMHIASPNVNIAGHQSPTSHSESSISSDFEMATLSSLQMSGKNPAECLHTNPRCVPLIYLQW